MIHCHACGKENEDAASECKRCRAPLREEAPSSPAPEQAGELGTVCRRCEAYNEAGVRICTACGLELFVPHASSGAIATPSGGNPTMTSELRALSLSDEEAAEAGLPGNGLPSRPAGAARAPEPPPPPPTAPAPTLSATVGGSTGSARRPPPSVSSKPPPSRPAPAAAEKPCANCGAANPPAAKFCFDCGTPFAKKSASPPPASAPSPSIEVDTTMVAGAATGAEDGLSTMASTPVSLDGPLPEEAGAQGWPPPGEAVPAESVAEEIPAEPAAEQEWVPFQARLVVEKGNSPGATFPLAHRENGIGAEGAAIALRDDPFVAPLSATVLFVEERLVVRDEGSANGVFVKLREPATLSPGDHFIAGERLFRFEGPVELPAPDPSLPLVGAPRPQAAAVRVVEVLAGGKTGRTCHRAGPSLTIGRSGCEMNFPGDALLAARHAEIRVAEDGSAVLADLGQAPTGVLLRVPPQGERPVQGGDLLQVGEQQLRIEIG